MKQEYTLGGMPVYDRTLYTNIHTHLQFPITDGSHMRNNYARPPTRFWEVGRKPQNWGKPTQTQGKTPSFSVFQTTAYYICTTATPLP